MKQIITLIYFLFLLVLNSFGQKDQGYLEVKGTVKFEREALVDAKVNLIKDGVKDKVISTDFEGKFIVRLDLNCVYELVFSKQGFFSKKLVFTTKVPSEDVGIWNNKFAIELIPEIEGFDASLFDEPIGKFEFNATVGDFDYDLVYTTNMQKRIKALMLQYEKARKESFNKIIAQADEAFNLKNYESAIELYDKSIDLDPYDPYPDEQIAMIDNILKQDQNADKNYEKSVKEADQYFQKQEYVNAQKFYSRALKYRDKQYPKDQLAAIDKLLVDPVADSSLIAYKNAIIAGDKAFTAKQYPNALAKFTEASGIKPNEQYPKDKIAELTALIAQLENDKKSKEEIEKAYLAAISLADAGFNQKDLSNARINYVKASSIKPAEIYPKTKITEIDNLLAAGKSLDEKYKGFIAIADQSFTSKQYESAKGYYQQALSIKPNESYPVTKIKEIDALLLLLADTRKNELEANYQKAIATADAAFNKKEYDVAKTSYNQAVALKNTEVYPKQKITEIDKILADMATKRRAYDLAIARADNNFNIEKWNEAKVAYQDALNLFPTELYPQTRINEIENKLLAMKGATEQRAAREKAYQDAIAKGDSTFNTKKYLDSKNFYSQALSVKPNEAYPKKKLEEIDFMLAAEKSLNEKYNALITAADQNFVNDNFQDSKTSYTSALQLKPNEAYPKQRIAEIDAKLAALLVNKQKQDQLKKQYDGLILQANQQYTAKSWEPAKSYYQQASAVLPEEVFPKQRIAEIDNLLASVADNNRKYNEAIQNGDVKFSGKLYGEALTSYNQATQLKPDETYPKQKIAEINGLLETMKKNEAAYLDFIKLADAAFSVKQLDDAKAKYQSALTLKPNEAYPTQRINEIDRLLAEQLRLKTDKDKLDAQYNQLITSADALFMQKKYPEAKSSYTQASVLKPDVAYPKVKISEIDNLLSSMAAQQKAYDQKMQDADMLYASKNYNGSLTAYQQASQLKPDEALPKQKIAELNQLIAQLQQKEQTYSNFIKLADASYASNQLDAAKEQYKSALLVKPAEAYPTQRIAEIDKMLAEQLNLKSQKEQLEAKYNSLITLADNMFNQKKYAEAKANYTEASTLKPAVMYPKERISEIDNLLSSMAAQQKAYDQKMQDATVMVGSKNYNGALQNYQQAAQLKPDEALPKQKIVEMQTILADLAQKQQQYQQLITKADNSFNLKSYQQAKSLYQQAQLIVPNEEYPKNQIVLIDQFLAEGAKRDADLQAKIKAYNAKILATDKLFELKDYTNALSGYSEAKAIKADETYPDQQIILINKLIKEDAAKLEASYNQAIQKGDQLKGQKSYLEAKDQYSIALNLKPKDPTAQSKLIEIQNLIDQQKFDKEKQDKINKDYNNYIVQADQALKATDFASALSLYKNAQGIKPTEKYPKDQIELCEKKIQEQKALAEAEAEKRRKDELAASQNSFEGKDFDYTGEQRDNKFLNDLAKLYPLGVTVENYNKPNKKIKRVIVNHDGIAKEYIEVIYSYGTYYFRNGQNISRTIFYSETKE